MAGALIRATAQIMLGLARLTWLEARRTAVGKAGLAAIGVAASLAFFVEHIVLTEHERVGVVAYAVIVRVAVIFVLAQSIIANTVRDLNEKIVDHFLALPITRMQYVGGKWLGWSAVAVTGAAAAGLPLASFASVGRVAWTLSFAAEALVSASLALVLAVTLGRSVTAMLAFACLYVFARVGYLIVLLSSNMGTKEGPWIDRLDAHYVEFAGYLLPRLDLFASTTWLTGGSIRLAPGLLQAAIYVALLGALINVELRRKEF